MLTVEPASAVPISFGLLLFAGEAGLVELIVGAAGAVESSTYVIGLEHWEVFPGGVGCGGAEVGARVVGDA